MKFACDSCQAEFLIADEKVGRRGVKVRCKRCSHVIIVRPTPASLATLDAESAADLQADRAAMPPLSEQEATGAPPSNENIPTEMEGSIEPSEAPQRGGLAEEHSDATQITAMPQATVPMADEPSAAGQSTPGFERMGSQPTETLPNDFASPIPGVEEPAGGEDSPEGEADAFDEHIEDAFAQMFEEAASGHLVPDDEEDAVPGLATDTTSSLAFGSSTPLSPTLLGMDESPLEPEEEAEPEAKTWFLAVGDENVGPLSLSELAEYLARGEMDGESLVWCEEMPDWEQASQVPALASLFVSSSPTGDFADVAAADDFPVPPAQLVPAEVPATALFGEDESPLGAGFGGSPLGDFSPTADDGWKPGAASALASLVEAEMQRAAEAPEQPVADGIQLPDLPAALVHDPMGAAQPAPLFAPMTNAALLGEGTPPPAELPNVAPMVPPHAAMLSAAPYGAPVAASRPVWQYAFRLVAAVGAAVAVVALVKIAFFGPATEALPPATQLPTAAPSPAPVAAIPAATATTSVPQNTTASIPGIDIGPQGATAVPSAAVPESAPVEMATERTRAASDAVPPPVEPAPRRNAEARSKSPSELSSKSRPKRRPERARRASRRAPEEPKEEAPTQPPVQTPKSEEQGERVARASKKSNPNCDPVLDFDCDEAPKKPQRSSPPENEAKKSLSRDDVLMVVKKNLASVNRCFDKHGGKGPVKMQWRIAKSGRTTGVTVLSDKHQNTPLGECIAGTIRGWQFPKYSGAAPPPVTIPFKARS